MPAEQPVIEGERAVEQRRSPRKEVRRSPRQRKRALVAWMFMLPLVLVNLLVIVGPR